MQQRTRNRSGGIFDLKRHASRESHITAVRLLETQGDIRKGFQPKVDDSLSTAASNGVLNLAFFVAEHHLAVSVADHLVPLFASICRPDSQIASDMKGARTKMTAAIKTIAEDMHNDAIG